MVELAAVGLCYRAVHKSYLEQSIARLAALEGDLGRVRQVFVSPGGVPFDVGKGGSALPALSR